MRVIACAKKTNTLVANYKHTYKIFYFSEIRLKGIKEQLQVQKGIFI